MKWVNAGGWGVPAECSGNGGSVLREQGRAACPSRDTRGQIAAGCCSSHRGDPAAAQASLLSEVFGKTPKLTGSGHCSLSTSSSNSHLWQIQSSFHSGGKMSFSSSRPARLCFPFPGKWSGTGSCGDREGTAGTPRWRRSGVSTCCHLTGAQHFRFITSWFIREADEGSVPVFPGQISGRNQDFSGMREGMLKPGTEGVFYAGDGWVCPLCWAIEG